MTKIIIPEMNEKGDNFADAMLAPMGRKSFLKFLGASVAISTLTLAGCKKDDNTDTTLQTVDLGSGDVGILNYAYALEQLEAAFYTQVLKTPYSGISTAEQQILMEIRDHELAHRDFFKAAIGSSAIIGLTVDFSSINFSDRASVLGAAKAFEDLGVSAYNGAGRLLTSPDYLTLAGKIVSVEARHASAIRDLLNPYSADFSGDDVVAPANGLDFARKPSEVLPIAGKYVKNTITFSNLPNK